MEMILRHYIHVSKSKMFKTENITEFKQQQQIKNTGKSRTGTKKLRRNPVLKKIQQTNKQKTLAT